MPDKKGEADASHSHQKPRDVDATAINPQAFFAVNGAGRVARAHDVVFRQGEPADAVFYILTGKVQLTVLSDHGKKAFIALFGPGDFFGEGCLAGQSIRLASAVATIATSLVRIDKATMVRLLHERVDFSEKFTAFLVSRNIQVEADLVDQLFNSSEKRLARLLLLLADFNNNGELQPIAPKISQELLAERVGTTRPRINYFMNKFRRLGFIEYNKTRIDVHPALITFIACDKDV
jgi:CRP-like cAMP-binding protein